jgi:hypothetical protein
MSFEVSEMTDKILIEMKIATFNYLNHNIQIEVPDPEDTNTIYVTICRAKGSYDPEIYNSYLTDYQFSAESNDPNDWVVEGIKSAIRELSGWGVKFHEPPPVAAADWDDNLDDDIPF